MADKVLGGRYTVQDKIGSGGMAVVYRGLDNVLGRTVAIKNMLPQYANDASFAARFKQEAQAAAALQSPYIVSVYDWGKDGNTYYIVMEYIRGTDLKSGIRKHGALDSRKVAQIGLQISQALSVAHKHDIIHRDVKPQNIMVQPDGNIKVMDFGIARAKNSHLTTDNSVLGTAHYVSPEQTQGKELGPTSDIYSLGIVMYEAATGKVPFEGEDAISVAMKQVSEAPVPPTQVNPRCDPALEAIILKCMQKNPDDRFQTADELARMLRDYLSGRPISIDGVLAGAGAVAAVAGAGMTSAATTPLAAQNADATQVEQPLPANRTAVRTPVQQSTPQTAHEEAAQRDKKNRRGMMLGIGIGLVVLGIIAALAMNFLGKGAEERDIPNLLGLTRDVAEERIKKDDFFELGSVREEYSDSKEGTVIDQDPDFGKTATRGTKIDLVISKGEEPPSDVTVPDLTNLSPSEAEDALKKQGLVGEAGDSVFSDTVDSGRVAKQSPEARTTAKTGDTVTYYLSKGTESLEVPSVLGRTQESAIAELEAAGFGGAVVEWRYSSTYAAGTVMWQSVTGAQPKGTTVNLIMSNGPEPAPEPEPSTDGGDSGGSGGSGGSTDTGGGEDTSGSTGEETTE